MNLYVKLNTMPRQSVAPIAAALKAARQARKLTQRELGKKIGTPQSHISTIEAGRVDLTTSSLIELARALELELVLVPRSLVLAIRGLIRAPEEVGDSGRALRNTAAHSQVTEAPVPPAYSLDDDDEGDS